MSTGDKAKHVSLFDNLLSETVKPLYSLEVYIAFSEEKKKFCGGIYIFKLQSLGHEADLENIEWTQKYDPDFVDEVRQGVAGETDSVVHFEKFREQDGQDIEWVPARALEMFDIYCKSHADLKLCAPALSAQEIIPYNEVVRRRTDPRELFKHLFEWYGLMKNEFEFDPWTEAIRRGIIGAEQGSR